MTGRAIKDRVINGAIASGTPISCALRIISYGFITDIDDVVGSEEYQQLPTEEKKKILLSILNTNNKKLKNNDEHRGELINVICDNGIVEKKSKHILEENEESYNVLSLDFLMQCDNYQANALFAEVAKKHF